MSDSEYFVISKIECPEVLEQADMLDKTGIVAINDAYAFLKINDDFIHKLQPKLTVFGEVKKPPYFGEQYDTGAHISIAYPEEGLVIDHGLIGQEHVFKIKELCVVRFEFKEAFVLFVECDSLIDLRSSCGLPEELLYKHNKVGLHITIGMRVKEAP